MKKFNPGKSTKREDSVGNNIPKMFQKREDQKMHKKSCEERKIYEESVEENEREDPSCRPIHSFSHN